MVAVPRVEFRQDELAMLEGLTSLNFAKFAAARGMLKEKFLLYKVLLTPLPRTPLISNPFQASRYYEDELFDALKLPTPSIERQEDSEEGTGMKAENLGATTPTRTKAQRLQEIY